VNAVELATALVIARASALRAAETVYEPWFHGEAIVVEQAVMIAHGFDRDQARAFIRTLLERID
jgi:transcription termination factor NusB